MIILLNIIVHQNQHMNLQRSCMKLLNLHMMHPKTIMNILLNIMMHQSLLIILRITILHLKMITYHLKNIMAPQNLNTIIPRNILMSTTHLLRKTICHLKIIMGILNQNMNILKNTMLPLLQAMNTHQNTMLLQTKDTYHQKCQNMRTNTVISLLNCQIMTRNMTHQPCPLTMPHLYLTSYPM